MKNINDKNEKQCAIHSVIARYFTDPYKTDEGEWKGLFYYKKMADRRSNFKFTLIILIVVAITLTVLFNVL